MLMNLPILSVKYHQYNMQHHVRDENGNYQMAAKEKKLQEREKLLEKKENKLKCR